MDTEEDKREPQEFKVAAEAAGGSDMGLVPVQDCPDGGCVPLVDAGGHCANENQIFMGNGFVSGAECFKLVDSLHKALEILGGIQQSHDRKEVEEGQEEVNEIAKNIYEKLTGKPLRRGI